MAKLASGSGEGRRREAIKPDSYDAWCYGSVELGTQTIEWEGEKKQVKKIKLFFEIPELMITYEKDGEEVTAPQVINVEFTNSIGKKAKIRPVLEAWLGISAENVDLATDLVGKPARLAVINKIAKSTGNAYAQVASISKCKDKDIKDLPPMHNKPMVFSVDEDGFDSDNFKNLYPWVRGDIEKSLEYQNCSKTTKTPSTSEAPKELGPEDLPFED